MYDLPCIRRTGDVSTWREAAVFLLLACVIALAAVVCVQGLLP